MPLILLIWWLICRIKRKRREREEAFRQAIAYDPEKDVNARFATDAEMEAAGCFQPGGILVGESQQTHRDVSFHPKVTPHAAIFGSSGIGKSSFLEGILLTWPYSVIVLDPTYEHAIQSSKWRSKYGEVYRWDPSNGFKIQLRELRRIGINPMGRHWLDARRSDLDSRCAAHAAAIISKVEGGNRYWYDSPRGMWTTCEIAQIMHGHPDEQNLASIAREIVNGDVCHYANYMYQRTWDRDLKARLNRLRTVGIRRPKSVDEFMETARTESEFLLNRAVGKALSTPDITFRAFRRRVRTLYVNAPLESSNVFGPASKLLLAQMLAELFQGEEEGSVPVLVIMDELFQYGRDLDALPRAFAAGRKYNVSLLGCMTSISELKTMFPHDYEGLIGNLGMAAFLDANDLAGSEYVSRLLGQTQEKSFSKSMNYDPGTFNFSHRPGSGAKDITIIKTPSAESLRRLHVTQNYSLQKRPLLFPHEVRQDLGLREELVFMRGVRPMRLTRRPFYETALAKRAQPSPFYRGKTKVYSSTPKKRLFSKWMKG